MLEITIPGVENFDESTNQFFTVEPVTLKLEHSLLSLSKWEAFFEKPFLSDQAKTSEETIWYIQTMCLSPDVSPEVFARMTTENYEAINEYINSKMTATWIRDTPTRGTGEIITSELIYYWMTVLHIPFECENWHLNRLFMLIKVTNHKNSPPKKMSRAEAARMQRETNAKRLAELGTRG